MCTNFGLTGASVDPFGKVLLGSVSDDPYDIRTRVVVERSGEGYAFIGTELAAVSSTVSLPDYNASVAGWPTRALNEKGLGYTWTFVAEKPDNAAPADGCKSADAFAEIMRTCATVTEAIDRLSRMPRNFSGAFMLADRLGELAVVEAGRKSLAVTQRHSMVHGGAAVSVNCWLVQSEEGLPICAVDETAVPNHSRYTRARALLRAASERADFDQLAAMLCDHDGRERFAGDNPWIPGHGYSICNHGSLREPGFSAARPAHGTVSAEIIDCVGGVFWYAYGWPCGEAPEGDDQLLQDRSWGRFIGFPLAALPAGVYTTLSGELTHLAATYFEHLLRRETAPRDLPLHLQVPAAPDIRAAAWP